MEQIKTKRSEIAFRYKDLIFSTYKDIYDEYLNRGELVSLDKCLQKTLEKLEVNHFFPNNYEFDFIIKWYNEIYNQSFLEEYLADSNIREIISHL